MNHSRALRGLGGGLAALAMTASLSITPVQAAPAKAVDLGRLSDYITSVKAAKQGKIIPGRYFVAVQGNPTAKGGSAAAVRSGQAEVKKKAAAAGIPITVTRSYERLWNGFSVQVSDDDAVALQAIAGVTAVYPVITVDRPVTASSAKPDMASAINMTGVGIVQNELGYTGAGIKVGVIDSGIDIDHPDLGGTGVNKTTAFPSKKVAGGWDFVGDAYDSTTGVPATPDPIPDDCGGHGTHVSGIIAGNGDTSQGGIRGVAPDATLYGYRVFGCEGTTDTDIILAAMERAATDKMDVVNLSLGQAFMTWADYPSASAADVLSDAGTVVVTSAGNSGESGGFSTGAPSVGHSAISVASFENTQITANSFTVAGRQVGYSNADGAPLAPVSGSLPIVLGDPLDACTSMQPIPAGTAVLIQRGGCTFRDKALAAQAAGAAAVVMYNNAAGTINPTVIGDPAITIPVVMVSQDDGEAIRAALAQASPQTLTWTANTVQRANPEGGLVSAFSSWGPAADLTLKPDLGAPGGNIWSTVPLEKGGHASMSGTSMASPHVAGSVALLLQARPELKGKWEAVRNLLQNTANPANPWSYGPTLGVTEMVVRQGAGLIQVDDAIESAQTTNVGKISVGDGDKNPKITRVTVTNTSNAKVTYTLSNLTGVGHVGSSDPQFDLLDANVAMPSTVTVRPHSTATFRVAISAPAGAPTGYLYGGWIQLKAAGAQELSIPYLGMAGDYQSLPLLTDAADGTALPSLARLKDGKIVLLPKDPSSMPVFSMVGEDMPLVIFHLEYPVADLTIEVYTATPRGTKGQYLGNVLTVGQYGRDDSNLSIQWDGTYTDTTPRHKTRTVKSGQYILEIKALHPGTNPAKAKSWETWQTQPFAIRTPKPGKAPKTLTTVDASQIKR